MSELDPQLERNYMFYVFTVVDPEGAGNSGPALKYVIVEKAQGRESLWGDDAELLDTWKTRSHS